MKQKVIKAKNLLLLRKSEVKRFKKMINKVIMDNRNEAKSTLQEYYQRIKEAIYEVEKESETRLELIFSKQQDLLTTFTVFF